MYNAREKKLKVKFYNTVDDNLLKFAVIVSKSKGRTNMEENMDRILYQEIDENIENKIIEQYGDWVHEYNCLVRGDGCYMVAALCGEIVAGFAAIHPARWIAPLEEHKDAFIEDIEVDEHFRRQGIGSHLVLMLEKWAKDFGYRQIRAWSSEDKYEALQMWYSSDYCMCPSAMLGQSIKPGFENKQIVGYYYAKMLNPNK